MAKNKVFTAHEPTEFFEMFFDDDIIQFLCECTNNYARQNNNHDFSVQNQTMKAFLAILLLSGYSELPQIRMYWESSPDVHNAAVADSMSRGRFESILKYFKVCDNGNLPENDRFGKVRNFTSMLNERWLNFFPGDTELSVDESMVPYFGRHGAKQHLHGKPIRFGYKIWCMCTRLGYAVQCEPYQGASTGE